ncbi:unnamed protein product [Acanthoscelides obtectus]|uniref:DDE Tnp4 domain-containing protein n=1 Tax=Acanthoscelides obtectus TaxID=200917 RepID=A0A9P0K754_ACAOB|nr:unnamed protein product [Acanthoscelides obtectus]CAK1626772.1 Protein ALP1-like [Acanthoscelides obtectus]
MYGAVNKSELERDGSRLLAMLEVLPIRSTRAIRDNFHILPPPRHVQGGAQPTENIWKKCAEEFENRWGFPNCIGSVDGKHVTIKRPNNSGSNYWCYLHKYSIVLMAIVGPDYKFICVDIGGFGKNSDGGIFETSNMGKRFEQNLTSVPAPRFLPGQNEICSYVLIGDEAFALKPYLMRPFPYKQTLTDVRKEKYNGVEVDGHAGNGGQAHSQKLPDDEQHKSQIFESLAKQI